MSKLSDDLISVIIPTYKGANKLTRAIDSLRNQTYQSIEIIVVDDNDPFSAERKETESVIRGYPLSGIKYIKHLSNRNGAAARNTGIAASGGSYICFLDDDDFYLPDRIEKSISALKSNHQYDAVYCGVVMIKNNKIKKVIKAEKPLVQKDILLNEMVIGTGSNLFFTKKAADTLTGFDEEFTRHQDLEFLGRLSRSFNIIHLDEALIVKAENETDNTPDYPGIATAKKLYFTKFAKEISQLHEQEKQNFFCYHYDVLLKSALNSTNGSNAEEAISNLMKYRALTLDEKIQALFIDLKYVHGAYKATRDIYRYIRYQFLFKPKEPILAINERTKEFILQTLGERT
ncbi:glycosyltransferase family 2 protein [Lentibacillus sediminis]|uniref:glycosyltransferase family 2 protein n=1 Tax=Lentibacillus sediminis TaxID=1940529 RepID=UPI000C1B8468|nr:glycosyltransferase family A protein [Lentibacillus sediminis]